MPKVIPIQERIKQSRSIHGDKYDYSLWPECAKSKDIIKTICPNHGVWEHSISNHIHKKTPTGCPKCAGKYSWSLEERREQAKIAHHGAYDYSLWSGNGNAFDYVTSKCNIHGCWDHTIDNHVRGKGCPRCADLVVGSKRRVGDKVWFDRFIEIHGDKYDYSLVGADLIGKSKVNIICKTHGVFSQGVENHAFGHGCNKCSHLDINEKQTISSEERKSLSHLIHGYMYDYSLWPTGKIRYRDFVTSICPHHGEWKHRVGHHQRGSSCHKCVNQNQQRQAYINNVDGMCLKYGISVNSKTRLRLLNARNPLPLESVGVWKFGDVDSCRSAETLLKREIPAYLTSSDLPEGYTETAAFSFLNRIIEVYESFGGVRI